MSTGGTSKTAKKFDAKPASTKKAGSRKRAPTKGPLELKSLLETALRREFPQDTVDISDGYKGNVHVMVVSRKFDGKSDYERTGWLREIIERAGLSKSQLGSISLLLALSPGEIK